MAMRFASAERSLLACLTLPACLLLALAPAALADAAAGEGVALARAARAQVGVTRSYDPAYVRIAYPGGDVPADRGACTDVVVRAFRAIGIDLQAKLYRDMRANFAAYPRKWGLLRPDRNIDHRRVPNLQRWFSRQRRALPVSLRARDFRPGDVVSWELPGGLDHVGVVSDRRVGSGAEARLLVVHNIGQGAQEQDVLFAWPLTGHYRWHAAGTPR